MEENYTSIDPDILDDSSQINVEDYICCICQLIPNPQTALKMKIVVIYFVIHVWINGLKQKLLVQYVKIKFRKD